MRVIVVLSFIISLLLAPISAQAQNGPILAERWYVEPILYPQAGFRSYSTAEGPIGISEVGLGVGALFHDLEAGVLSGMGRGEASVWSGGGGLGFDARLGSFWTPRVKWGGGRLGLDVFYNSFTQSNFAIPGTLGVDVPMDVIIGPRSAYLLLGITTGFVTNEVRRVQWEGSTVFGVGHEFEWRIGGGLTLGRYGVRITYSQRTSIIQVNGEPLPATSSGISMGFNQSPYVPPDRKK